MTKRMSSISSFVKRFLISSVFGKLNFHVPNGGLPIIGIHLPALPVCVLMMLSFAFAGPPIGTLLACRYNADRPSLISAW